MHTYNPLLFSAVQNKKQFLPKNNAEIFFIRCIF